MTLRPLVLVALAVLVPVFCADIGKQRCELRDQLQRPRIWELASVICEVEKFIIQSLMGPTMSPPPSAPSNSSTPAFNSSTISRPMAPGPRSSSEEDSSEEDSSEENSSEERKGHKYLRQCVAITNSTSVKVDAACLRKGKVFMKVYVNAGEECKSIDPKDFFQGCSGPPNSNRNSNSKEPKEKFDSKERRKSKAKFGERNRH